METNVRIGRVLTCILTEHLCPAKGWRVATLDRSQPDRVVVTLVATSATATCAGCGERKTRLHDVKPVREWRHLDCFGILTVIRAPVRRFKCRRCGIRVERVPWARTRSRFTHDFEAEVLRRARDTSILGVCRQLRLHWTSVMRLIEQWVSECADQHFRRPLRVLGVDEVSYGRGQQKFLTIVWDHQRSRIVWIGKGRDRDTLGGFFAKLGHRRAHRLEAVTMDMAKGYIAAVTEHAPQATIVFDRFHIERYLTRALDEVRKAELWRRGGIYRAVVRGKKWLLLRKFDRLPKRKKLDLAVLLQANARLFRAYVLKEQFGDVWTARSAATMKARILAWRKLLNYSRLTPLIEFWERLMRHLDGVCAWAPLRLTNAALEGNNARVRGISQRAHGYRNPDNLMLVLYHASWK